jgi:hypothetical protein
MIAMRTLGLVAAALLIGGAACDDDDDFDDLTMADVAGDYEARGDTGLFSVSVSGIGIDLLDAGGFIELTLEADGTTTGTLFAPGVDDGEDLNAELDGTWTLREDDDGDWVVELSQGADTFLRDVELEVESNGRLEIDEDVDEARVRVILVRQ